MVSEKRKEVVKELLRRRFEETKEQVSKNADSSLTVFVGTENEEQVYELEPGNTQDEHAKMGQMLAEARKVHADYIMVLYASLFLKLDAKDLAIWKGEESEVEKALMDGSLRPPSLVKILSGNLHFADGSSTGLFSEFKQTKGKIVVGETVECPLSQSEVLPSWEE